MRPFDTGTMSGVVVIGLGAEAGKVGVAISSTGQETAFAREGNLECTRAGFSGMRAVLSFHFHFLIHLLFLPPREI